jgi:hypothetical protein
VLQSAGTQYPTNALFVKDFASNLLRTSFPNMMPEQVAAAVTGMLELEEHRMFKHHMRDFLVQVGGRLYKCDAGIPCSVMCLQFVRHELGFVCCSRHLVMTRKL